MSRSFSPATASRACKSSPSPNSSPARNCNTPASPPPAPSRKPPASANPARSRSRCCNSYQKVGCAALSRRAGKRSASRHLAASCLCAFASLPEIYLPPESPKLGMPANRPRFSGNFFLPALSYLHVCRLAAPPPNRPASKPHKSGTNAAQKRRPGGAEAVN